jgi:class 3 adenylate cyclase
MSSSPAASDDRPPAPKRGRLPVTAVLSLGFGGLMLIGLVGVMLITLGAAERNTRELLRALAETTVNNMVDLIDEHLAAPEHQVDYLSELASSGKLDLGDRHALEQILTGALAAVPQVRGIAVFARDLTAMRIGYVNDELVSLDGEWGDDEGLVGFIQQFRDPDWRPQRDVVWVKSRGSTNIALSRPLRLDGELRGVVSSVVSIGSLSKFVSKLSDEFDAQVFILYGRDQVLGHSLMVDHKLPLSQQHPLPNLQEIGDPVLAEIRSETDDRFDELLEIDELQAHVVEVEGRDFIFFYQEIHGWSALPWTIGLYVDAERVAVRFNRLIWSGLLALGVVALAVLLAVLYGRMIARPIRRLADGALAIRNLDFQNAESIEGSRVSEIDAATSAFNAMLGGLRWFETYVPRSLVVRLMRMGPTATRSEIREITVLFSDIVGFTSLSERLSAAELGAFLNRHFGLLAHCIDAEGGTLDKYIGDSVMAFWGAPSDQPDHAERAARAALAIADAIAEDNAERRAAGLATVRLRIGLHSGSALVGNIGAPGRVNYTLVGDTVNSAQRLESLGREFTSEGGEVTILLSGETAERLSAGFELRPLGRQQLRGRAGEIEVFRLEGMKG